MADTVKIGADDACAGLETPGGRIYPFKNHVAELPAGEASRFLRAGRSDHLHIHTPVGSGWTRRRETAMERIFGKED